jgi:hypothetical protein
VSRACLPRRNAGRMSESAAPVPQGGAGGPIRSDGGKGEGGGPYGKGGGKGDKGGKGGKGKGKGGGGGRWGGGGPGRGSKLDRAKNDFSQHFVDSRQRPANFIRDSNLTDRFDEYPKLKELIEAKDERIATRASPAMFKNVDLRSFDLTTLGTKFDVVLIDPPWEEYRRRAAAAGGLEDEDEEQARCGYAFSAKAWLYSLRLCSVLAMAGVEPQGHHGAAHRGDHRDALLLLPLVRRGPGARVGTPLP